jgi:hypothetical protein
VFGRRPSAELAEEVAKTFAVREAPIGTDQRSFVAVQQGLPSLIFWQAHCAALGAMQREAINGLLKPKATATHGAT